MEKEFNKRFFQAIEALVEMGKLKSLSGFIISIGCQPARYRCMRQTYLYEKQENPQYKRLEFKAVYQLVKQYKVSLKWLYFGTGNIFSE